MNEYGTHYPVLSEILKKFKMKNVLEFGTGFFSTGLFVKKCKSVLSIEMQYVDWFDKVKEKYFEEIESGILSIKCIVGDSGVDAIKYLEDNHSDQKFDMVFVDGAGGSRYNCANYAKTITDTIICHDTEYPGYGWENIVVDGEWVWLDVKIYDTWTSVMTKRKDIIDYINTFDYMKLRDTYKDVS